MRTDRHINRRTALRIAHITATFPPYEAGGGRVCYYNAIGLAECGHQVDVYTAKSADSGNSPSTSPTLRIHRLKSLLQIGNAPFLPGLVNLRRADIIHLHLPFIFGAELIWLTSLLRNIPYLVTYHNDLIGDGGRAALFETYSKLSLPLIVSRAKKIGAVTIDHALHSRSAALFKSRRADLVEIPNGVDTAHFCPNQEAGIVIREMLNIPLSAKVIGFVGALDRAHHYRRVDLLLHAIKQTEYVYALIVGDGNMRTNYEQLACDLALESRIRFVGKIAHPHLPSYINAIDVMVLPSQLQESFGMVLIEAMACGKPVIASNIPGVRSVVCDGVDGLLVESGSANALAGVLRTLFDMPSAQVSAMGIAGRTKTETKYTWSRIVSLLENLYQEIMLNL